MGDDMEDVKDRRILAIAAEAAETTDNHVPVILLRLKGKKYVCTALNLIQ